MKGTPESGKIRLVESRKIAKEKSENSDAMRTLLRTAQGWLLLIHAGLNNKGGFPERVSKYLGKKYGYSQEAGANAGSRVADVLRVLASRLKEQRQSGSRYYIGDALTAVDIYSAPSMAMFVRLPPEQCQMDGPTRAAFESRDPQIEAALDPILFQHRDMIFAESLELPLSL